MAFTSYMVDNDRLFEKLINNVKRISDDLRVPFGLIAQDFHTSEAALFNLKGPGQFPDLREKTKQRKIAAFGSAFPILVAKGRLRDSLTSNNSDSIVTVGRASLTIGTKVPYGRFHQDGTKNLPVRKFLFIGPESIFATSAQKGRLQRWFNILVTHMIQESKRKGISLVRKV